MILCLNNILLIHRKMLIYIKLSVLGIKKKRDIKIELAEKKLNFEKEEIELTNPNSRDFLQQKTKDELIDLILIQKEEKVPISIFKNDLGPLEVVVKFLRENKVLTIKQIAVKLNRSSKTIWTTYNNVKDKKIKIGVSRFFIPVSFLSKKKLSILESLTSYLKDVESLTFHQIAELTNRDDRTIWTCHHRAVLKIGDKK